MRIKLNKKSTTIYSVWMKQNIVKEPGPFVMFAREMTMAIKMMMMMMKI